MSILLDFDEFSIQKPLSKRGNLLGYIGRLREGKGILNFMEAFPVMLDRIDNVRFLVGGNRALRSEVEEHLSEGQFKRQGQSPWLDS